MFRRFAFVCLLAVVQFSLITAQLPRDLLRTEDDMETEVFLYLQQQAIQIDGSYPEGLLGLYKGMINPKLQMDIEQVPVYHPSASIFANKISFTN